MQTKAKRFFAMLLVVAMILSMTPLTTFATESDTSPLISVTPYDSSGTATGQAVISTMDAVTYTGYATFTDVPYYHITVPAGTAYVLATYEEVSMQIGTSSWENSGTVQGYYADLPGWTGGAAQVSYTHSTDSVTLTIPLSYSLTAEDGTVTTKSFVLNADGTGSAFAPEMSGAQNYVPINFFTFEYAQSAVNTAPVIAAGAITEAAATVNAAWELDVSTLFTDADGDTLTYTAKVNDVDQSLVGSVLSYTPTETGTYSVVLTASDGEASVSHTITLTVTTGNRAPVLKAGVSATKEATVPTNYAYNLTELQNNEIFEDPDGDVLNYTSYYYQRSTDGGTTWGPEQNFQPSLFGFTTIQFTETEEGTYKYRFRAFDGQAYSTDTWTLTLTVSNAGLLDISFHVGQDRNYSSTNKYPLIKLYQTAGHDEDQLDYIATYEVDNVERYLYDENDYTVEKDSNGYYITVDNEKRYLTNYRPIVLTTSSFTVPSTEAESEAAEKGTLVDNYNMFYAKVPSGQYSFRAYGYNSATNAYDVYLGGQSLTLPTEVNVDGGTGGGTDIYLRLVSIYTTSKKTNGNNFDADDYTVKVDMPVMGGKVHSGAAYSSGTYTYYPFMMYAAGNASLYNIYAYPKDEDNYIFSQSINNTTAAGYTPVTKTISINTAVTLQVTVPTNATFTLYFQHNNFNTKPVEAKGSSPGGDNTVYTYKISKNNSNYTWRLEDTSDTSGSYVTKAGWLRSYSADAAVTFDFDSGDTTDKHTHDFSGLGTTVATRDEAEIQAYLTPSGFKYTSESETIRAYRLWQIINSDTANIMIEPDFNIDVLSGAVAINPSANDNIAEGTTIITTTDGGNAGDNWLTVKPNGTAIVALSYNAIDVYASDGTHYTHGGLYPATNPERVNVFVISSTANGTGAAHIPYNSNGTTTSRSDEWDYNYDNWFYLSSDTAPTLDFTTTNVKSVRCANVTTNNSLDSTISDFVGVTADSDGWYHASLLGFRTAGTKGGTVIIELTDNSDKISYRLVRVVEITATVSNASHPDETVFMPGDDVTITFENTYRGIYKYSGIFNPTTYYLYYTSGDDSVRTTVSQYQQMDTARITLTIPEDLVIGEDGTAQYTFTNGYTYGSMYSAASPFSTLYNMTDTGVGTNFNAVTVNFCLNRFPDIPITVSDEVFYDVRLDVTNVPSGATSTVTLKDSAGNVLTATDGVYENLPFGTYTYIVECAGCYYVYDTFTLGSADAGSVSGGILTKTIALTQSTAWDGVTTSEPATDSNGVYQIGTAAELAWFAAAVNSGSYTISAALTADIDLAFYNWTPIGGTSSSTAFKGSFDGGDHTIRNLGVYYSATTTTAPYKGLFGYVYGTSSAHVSIHDLNVTGKMILTSTGNVSSAHTGGVVAYANYADITHVTSDVDITVRRVGGNWNYVGGVVGYAGNTTITNCGNSGTVEGYMYVGGISGYSTGAIYGCYNEGNIFGSSNYVGGITAYSNKAITACYNTGTITGNSYVGGIVASAAGSSAAVSNCYNVGTITATNPIYAGAVIGYMNNANATTANLYYLSGICSKGIGTSTASTQTAASLAKSKMQNDSFVTKMNNGLSSTAFVKETKNYPLLAWQND